MKNILFLTVLIFLLFSCQDAAPESEPPRSETQAIPVSGPVSLNKAQQELAGIETGTISQRTMSTTIECAGQIEVPPMFHYSVYSPVSGFVQTADHLEGDYIKKGTVLTTLSHSDLIRLQGNFLEATSELDFLQSEFRRKETLAKEDAGSQRAFEEAQSHYNTKLAIIKGLEAELDLIGISSKNLRENGQIQKQLTLFAPASGFVTAVNINRGKLVHPTDELFEIIDNQHLHLELSVFAKDLPKVKAGQRIEARLPGSQNRIPGEVHLVGKMIDLEKKTAQVHVHLENEALPLAVGTYLPARIFVEEKEVPSVPITALVREGEDQYIFIKGSDGFLKTPVQTGMSSDGFIELLDWGHPAETIIVTKGAYYIQDTEE